jgi:hypothetical protein
VGKIDVENQEFAAKCVRNIPTVLVFIMEK